jgi:hypothetical protein
MTGLAGESFGHSSPLAIDPARISNCGRLFPEDRTGKKKRPRLIQSWDVRSSNPPPKFAQDHHIRLTLGGKWHYRAKARWRAFGL